MFHKLALGIVTAVTAVAGWFGIASKKDIPVLPPPVHITENKIVDRVTVHEQLVGANIPVVVSLFETSLQSSISSSASSMTLVSGTDRQGTSLSGYMCFTIDEGSSVAEFVCGTASSTSVTSLTRGISPLTGTSTVASLQFVHRRGASVKITNYPQLAIVSRVLNGNETLPNRISYDSTIATTTFTTYNLVNKQYVDGVALQGAPTATTTVAGIAMFATPTQLSNGTIGNGSYFYVPSVAQFRYTPTSATSVPVSNASGKIAQGWLDLTQPFAFTGSTTFASATTTLNATTTIAASGSNKLFLNGVGYVFPSTQGAASTTLINNGNGTFINDIGMLAPKTGTYASTSPVTGTLTIPHGLGRMPRYVRVSAFAVAVCPASSIGTYDGTNTNYTGYAVATAGCSSGGGITGTGNVIYLQSDDSSTITATLTYTATNLIFAVTNSSGPASFHFLWEAY